MVEDFFAGVDDRNAVYFFGLAGLGLANASRPFFCLQGALDASDWRSADL